MAEARFEMRSQHERYMVCLDHYSGYSEAVMHIVTVRGSDNIVAKTENYEAARAALNFLNSADPDVLPEVLEALAWPKLVEQSRRHWQQSAQRERFLQSYIR